MLWGAHGWHRERRRSERSTDELYQGNQKPAVSKARTNSKCDPATHAIDRRSCVVLHVPLGAAQTQIKAQHRILHHPSCLPLGRAALSHTPLEGGSGVCSSKAILQPKLLCPPASKSFPSQGREIIHPLPSVVCGFGHLGQGLHQLVAPRLVWLCGGTCVKTWEGKKRSTLLRPPAP